MPETRDELLKPSKVKTSIAPERSTKPAWSAGQAAVGFLLGVAALFVGVALYSYDPADPPTSSVDPPNREVSNLCGPIGARLAGVAVESLGLTSFGLVWASLGSAISLAVSRKPWGDFALRGAGYLLVIGAGAGLLAGDRPSLGSLEFLPHAESLAGRAGLVGLALAEGLTAAVSRGGSLILLIPALIGGFALARDPLMLCAARLSWRGGRYLLNAFAAPFGDEAAVTLERPVSAATIHSKSKPSVADESIGPVISRPGAKRLKRSIEASCVDSTDESSAVEEPSLDDEIDSGDDEFETPTAEWRDDKQNLKIVRSRVDVSSTERPAAPKFTAPVKSNVRLPDLEILEEGDSIELGEDDEKIRENAVILERTCADFNIKAQVVHVDTGPVVTQYELELSAGQRAAKIVGIERELSMALRADSIRIVAPIPGKNAVGVEVPNSKPSKVSLRDVIAAAPPQASSMRLPMFLGKDVKGRPLVYDLATMPHLLIAGRTGTGKSVCLNTLILSVLMTRTPDQVRMIMIDPKKVEMVQYGQIPHLLHPVVKDMQKAEALLAWAVEKMEERYRLLSRVGVRHLEEYNKLGIDVIRERLDHSDGVDHDDLEASDDPVQDGPIDDVPETMPYILIIIDEMAELMMTSGKEVESHICRIAQLARAVGIHLVLATQRPSADVITGLIKANLPARISFQVASKLNSQIVLDEMGAEKLLGNGDMLFLVPSTSRLVRAKGTYVSDAEVREVTAFLSAQAKPQFSTELLELKLKPKDGEEAKEVDLENRDELYDKAVEMVIQNQRGSVSLLQRALKIGFGRAGRIIDYMAAEGIVGPYNGSKFRDVLVSYEEWRSMREDRRAG